MMWTALLLSRVQFAFTVSFHIIFPSFTIGLAAWLTVLEAFHLISGKPVYRRLFEFWLKIFGVTFGLGVVSGIVLAFEFGMNWSRLSEVTGPIQGPLPGERLLLWATFLSFPLPFIATLTGWFTAEVGRQPWSVYGALRTADAVTPTLTAGAVTVSLIIFAVVYLVIFSFGTLYVYRLLKAGPVQSEPIVAPNPKRPLAVTGGNPIVKTTLGRGWL